MSLPLILIVGGLIIIAWIWLWSRQRGELSSTVEVERSLLDSPYIGSDDAVLVAREHGQLLYANDSARRWLGTNGSVPHLEAVARLAQPTDNFLELFAVEGQASFQLGNRWVEASSHRIPAGAEVRTVVVMRELTSTTNHPDALDLNQAMSLVNEIGETVNASMGVEQVLQTLLTILVKAMKFDAGEICLWDEATRALSQRAWVGDGMYVVALAEAGGRYDLDEGITGWVARHRRPLLVTDRHDPTAVLPKLTENPYQSFVAVPLTLGERFLGTLEIASLRPNVYTGRDLALLQAVSKPVAVALYNAEIYADQVRRIDDLASLQQIVNEHNNQGDAALIYQSLNERIATLLSADMCGVFLYDAERQSLVPEPPFFGLPEALIKTISVPVPLDSVQYEIWERQPYWVSNDVVDEPLVEALGLKPVVSISGVLNTAWLPLQVSGRRFGAIVVSNKRTEGGFTPRDLQNLTVLAAQASIIVENIRLFQRERRIDTELVGLQEITHAIGALSHEGEFYSEITERIARLMEINQCGILLYEERSQRLIAKLPFYGVPNHQIMTYSIDVSPGTVMNELWETYDYWYTNKVQADALVFEAGLDELAARIGTEKTLIAALAASGRRLGVVQVSNKRDGSDFSDNDARLLQIFATQTAAIIENARLYREVQRSMEEAQGLRRVAELAGAVLTTQETFTPVLAEIGQLMDSEMVYINVLDHQTGSLVTYPRWVHGMELTEPLVQDVYSKGFEQSVAVSHRPYMGNDVLNDDRVLPGYKTISQKLGIRKAILVPLIVGDRTLGELGVANRLDGFYDSEDLAVLQVVAAQTASALERLLLYEATGNNLSRRNEELEAISRVSNELAQTLDLDQILNVIREETLNATGADGSTVALLVAQTEWRNPNVPEIQRRLGSLEGVIHALAEIEQEAASRSTDTVLITDYEFSTLMAPSPQVRSAMAAPIVYLDTVVGVIHLYHRDPNRFDDRAAAFLTTMASKAALGYGAAMRYQETMERSERQRRRVEQLNRIFEISHMVSSADPENILEAIAYSVSGSVGYDSVVMTMVDEDAKVLRRVAQAGMPVEVFERSKSNMLSLDKVERLLRDEFRVNDLIDAYFYPVEKVGTWYVENISALSTSFDGNRTIEFKGRNAWRDGDMLLVTLRGATGALLGVMALDRPHDNRRPDRTTLEVLEIFAHQAATTIENTRLYLASVRSAEQEARLNEVVEAISRTLDSFEIVEAAAHGLLRMIPLTRMTFALVDAQEQGFEILRASVKDGQLAGILRDRRPSLGDTALRKAYDEGQDTLYRAGDPQIDSFEDLQSWHQQGEMLSLALPLLTGGETLGAMLVGSSSPLLIEVRPLLKRLSQIIASAMQNARLFTRALGLQSEREAVVESIQQGIVVLNSSGRIRSANQFMFDHYNWDEDDAVGQDLFTYDPALAEVVAEKLTLALDEGKPGELVKVYSEDPNRSGVYNYYTYPLRAGDVVRGVVLLVENVTDQTRLEESVEQRAAQLSGLTEVSTRITSSLEREEVVTLALTEMGHLLGYDVMTLWRRNGSYMVLEGRSDLDGVYLTRSNPGEDTRVRFIDYEQARQVVETQRVVNSDRVNAGAELPGHEHAESFLGVPLVNQGHVVGMIVLTSQQPHAYDSISDQNIAFAFASQVAIALANADLFEQTFDRTNELGTLLEAAQATSATQDLNSVFQTVVELMFGALDMDDCAIMLWDEVDNQLEVQVDMNRVGDTDRITPKGTRFDLALYPAKLRALREREVVVITADEDDSPYQVEVEDLRKNGDTARMLVPLVSRENTIGLIQLEQKSAEKFMTQQKVRLAKALGAQVAVAIENARLNQEISSQFSELMIINDLSRAITSTLDLSEMIEIVGAQVPGVTGSNELYLALYDSERREITFPLAVHKGERYHIPPRPLTNDEVSFVITKQRPLSLGADYYSPDELRRSLGIINGEGDIKSYLGYPVTSGGKVLGVLALRDTERTRAFTLNDQRILETVSAQLGAAIQNVQLFTQINGLNDRLNREVAERTHELQERSMELEDERDRLDTLYQITSELARSLDIDRLLNRALGMVSKAVNAQDGAIVMIDQITDQLYSRAVMNPNSLLLSEDGERTVHPAEALAQHLIEAGEQVILENDLHLADYWDETAPGAAEWRSALAVLLETNEDPIGVMVLFSREEDAFGEPQLKLMEAAANQVASSFNNADLYHLIKDQAERLGAFLKQEQEEAEKTGAILEGIEDGVILADAHGQIIIFNPAAERILGIPRDDAKNQSMLALLAEYGSGTRKWMEAIDNSIARADEPAILSSRLIYEEDRLSLGDKVLTVQLSPLHSAEKFLGTVSVFRDITRDVELDRRKSQFIANVSHEFRTPLTPIKGYTDLLIMGAAGEISDPQKRILVTIKENVDRLTALVEDVLKIADIDSGKEKLKVEPINLNELVETALSHVRSQTNHQRKQLQVNFYPAAGLPPIEADREKLTRIIANVVDNAFNYTPDGGLVEINVGADGEQHALIEVRDTGVGIPEEYRGSVWNRFERHDQTALTLEVAGTGLGLPIVKELVEMHGGDVWFESEINAGTTFYIRLPMTQPDYLSRVTAATENGHEPGSR
ncbi:MAG: GAF domain-containing protein [bacterium]|nr:GAF domain-containing protein [bacterium]